MINAKQAREQAAENKVNNAIKDIESNIKKAISKGKNETTFLCSHDLVDRMAELLTEAGYTVTPVQGGVKVYWG